MRVFHSLWTKPALDKRWDTSSQLESNLWLYTLSVIYARKQGLEIVLHTDSFGKNLLGHLPYSYIYTTLDKIPSNIPTMVWAYGKFMALKEESLGSIHIDGDVMITSKECVKALNYDGNDLIIQHVENSYPGYLQPLIDNKVVSSRFFDTNYAYNCGIVGINNAELKNAYLNYYFDSTEKVANNKILKKEMDLDKHFCVDLPLEQWSLAILAKDFKVKSLLKGISQKFWEKGSDIQENALSLGYLHLIGKNKYDVIDKVKFYVLALDKNLYYKTKEVINKYKSILK